MLRLIPSRGMEWLQDKMAEEGALLIGALLRRRGAGGGCHRNAPFVFIVDKIGSAHFPIHARTRSHAATNKFAVALANYATNKAR